jgi:hypothetical protein
VPFFPGHIPGLGLRLSTVITPITDEKTGFSEEATHLKEHICSQEIEAWGPV